MDYHRPRPFRYELARDCSVRQSAPYTMLSDLDRNETAADPSDSKLPRAKQHDDKTIVAVGLSRRAE
jgi:hypothetical protein